jgi:hypothetical protein
MALRPRLQWASGQVGVVQTARGNRVMVRVLAPAIAKLRTALGVDDADLEYTALAIGPAGNAVTIAYTTTGGSNVTLLVTVASTAISVRLATNPAHAIISTADDVRAGVLASGAAMALLRSVEHAPDNDGSGVVPVMTAAALRGGDRARYRTNRYLSGQLVGAPTGLKAGDAVTIA